MRKSESRRAAFASLRLKAYVTAGQTSASTKIHLRPNSYVAETPFEDWRRAPTSLTFSSWVRVWIGEFPMSAPRGAITNIVINVLVAVNQFAVGNHQYNIDKRIA